MNPTPALFTPYFLRGLLLKNRITMAPMYVGYGNSDGTVSALTLEHYRNMAASGAAMIVVESSAVHASGMASPKSMRLDHDDFIEGLTKLADTVQAEGARAFLQIGHAGRYANLPYTIAPSPVKTGEVVPVEMSAEVIDKVIGFFASAARRVKGAGFDGVEIHGGAGYLLDQFLSLRTNWRSDSYGGSLENRMRFPLKVVDAIREAVGEDFPIGYRFLADEWLPGGLEIEESREFAKELAARGIDYLSITAGTYDSFYLPEYLELEKQEGYMVHLAEAIKRDVPETPVIASGRIQSPAMADALIQEGKADLIGLARVLFADPLWPKKAAGLAEGEMIPCDRACSLCTKRAMIGLSAFCPRWDKQHRREFLKRMSEIG